MSGNSEKVRIGVIGLGRVATSTHIPALKLLDGVEIRACAETNMDRVKRVEEFLNLENVFTDYNEMNSSKLVDAVYVCVPPHAHYDVVMSALENGLHVLCEKPMGANLDQAVKMNALAKKKGLILMPGFKYRYNKHFQKARQVVSSGLLGAVIQVEASFMTPGPYISWDPKSDWYLDKENGGAVYDIGVHIVELVSSLVPNKIIGIYADASKGYYEYDSPTNISCSFVMENKVTGTMNFGWRSSADLLRIAIYGTGGAVVAGLKGLDYFNAGTDPKDRILNHLRNSLSEFKTVSMQVASIIKGSEVSNYDLEQAKSFVKAVKKRKPPAVTGDTAVYVHRVLEGIERSIRSNNQFVL